MSLAEISRELHKDHKSLRNRLQSIIHDSEWVAEVAQAYNLPLVPNERCGLWYTSKYSETSYFKSTDGHINQWDFSTRRLNFHLLELINANRGIVIVDSTRRGKKMPDALSKTIPIWCAVLNAAMFNDPSVYSPPGTVVKSEQLRIQDKMPELIAKYNSLHMSPTKLDKPLRPIWVYPGMSLPFEPPEYEDFYPVVCCTASFQCQDGVDKRFGFTYVQGAADDHELWSNGLTPQLFWENAEFLGDSSKSENELVSHVAQLLQSVPSTTGQLTDVVEITGKLKLAKVSGSVTSVPASGAILLGENVSSELENVHVFPLASGKKGSKELRNKLPQIMLLVDKYFDTGVVIACDKLDLSVGIVLCCLCQYYNKQMEPSSDNIVTKQVIRQHLVNLLDRVKVNPSRATLQAVNSFFMS